MAESRMFEDRRDAGRRLASLLEPYRDSGAVVLAIPRGGVEVGYQVASLLNLEFGIIIAGSPSLATRGRFRSRS